MRLLLLSFLVASGTCFSQNNLLEELELSEQKDTNFIISTFQGTRLVNGQSVETKHKGELEFIFSHRFGRINDGIFELFGLDQAYVRIGLEYGITDRLGVGMGRNSVDKTMDGYLRYKLLKQSNKIPVTVTVFGNMAIRTSPKKEEATYDIMLRDRISYTSQLLIARKFSYALSLQLMPTIVHKNTVDQSIENNDQLALGIGGRIRVSKSVSLTSEYYYRLNVPDTNPYYNSLGFGIDIETGGHVFQLVLSNSRGLTERAFLTETNGEFFDGDIHLGFNITRTFQVKNEKK